MQRLALGIILGLAAAGCRYRDPGVPSASAMRSGVGRTTYDDVVRQLGAPRLRHDFKDGSITAEWVVGRRAAPRISLGLAAPENGPEPAGQTLVDSGVHPIVRRIEFRPDGRLSSVSEQTE